MRLLVADDHTLFRDALAHYVEKEEPGSIFFQARDLNEAVNILHEEPKVDLVLLDLNMPGMNGVNGINALKEEHPMAKVALISGMAEKENVEEALKLGACAYFPKTLSLKVLIKAIRDVIDGEVYIPKDHNTAAILPSYYADKKADDGNAVKLPENMEKLTKREKEVLSYLLQGASNKDIAKALDLQLVTIKLHVRGVCRKLGVKSRLQAALVVKEMGILESK